MLSIGRLAVSGGAEYYLDKVANSVDDYYLGRGEAPGQWMGSAARNLGLTGEVAPDALRNLLAGRAHDGQPLCVRLRADRRPGYDLTFSAPKGVSLLWAMGSDDVRAAVSAAHDGAVVAVLGQLSREACFARRGDGGHRLVEAQGFLGAAFRHRTSRAGDPQLHTHVVVPNLVQGSDGIWSAPDGRHLFVWAKTAGTLYQAALRAELAPLGLVWNVRRSGLGELAGIPKAILQAFSTRRADIEAAMEARGSDSHRTARTVALATRPRHHRAAPLGDFLRERWRERLEAIQLPDGTGGRRPATLEDLSAAIGQEPSAPPGAEAVEEIFRALLGEDGVSLDDWEIDESRTIDNGAIGTRSMPVTLLSSTFTRRDAISAVARAFDVTPTEAVALTDDLLARPGVVRLLAEPGSGGGQGSHPERAAGPGNVRRSPLFDHRAPRRRATDHRVRRGQDRAQGRPGSIPPSSIRSSSSTDIWIPSRRRACGHCSRPATATTWSSDKPGPANPPCSAPPVLAGSGPASG